MRFLKYLIGAMARIIFAVMAYDILYLYYQGHWYDPWIEKYEVGFWWFCMIVGVLWTVVYLINVRREIEHDHSKMPE